MVIFGVSEHNNCNKVQLFTLVKTCSNKCRANACSLMHRYYRHWGEPHHFEIRMIRQRDRRKHNVTDKLSVFFSNERNNWLRLLS